LNYRLKGINCKIGEGELGRNMREEEYNWQGAKEMEKNKEGNMRFNLFT
jgi:hypothetical protein